MSAIIVNEKANETTANAERAGYPRWTLHPKRTTRRARSISLMESSSLTTLAHLALCALTCCCRATVQWPDRLLTTPCGNTLASLRGCLNPQHGHQDRSSLRSRRWHYSQTARPAPQWKRHGGHTTSGDSRLALACRAANSGLISGLCFFVGAMTLLKCGDRVQHRVALPNGSNACLLCSRQTLQKEGRDD